MVRIIKGKCFLLFLIRLYCLHRKKIVGNVYKTHISITFKTKKLQWLEKKDFKYFPVSRLLVRDVCSPISDTPCIYVSF